MLIVFEYIIASRHVMIAEITAETNVSINSYEVITSMNMILTYSLASSQSDWNWIEIWIKIHILFFRIMH